MKRYVTFSFFFPFCLNMLRRVDQQTKRTNENEVETKESLITNKTSKKGLGVSDKSLNTPPLLRSDSGLKLFKNTNAQEKSINHNVV